MATVIFDLDSTLLSTETLEKVLLANAADPQTAQKIKALTEQGMSGEISFFESVRNRLNLATLKQDDLLNDMRSLPHYLTPGMKELISELKEKGISVWIVSGALRETVIAAGHLLGIPKEHCLGIELEWDQSGHFLEIDSSMAINRAKWEGAQSVASGWSRPAIAIGDGITDYALYDHGLVDAFIAFTEHKRRQVLLDKGIPEAKNVDELRQHLENYGNIKLSKE